jgi:hypothetical protein
MNDYSYTISSSNEQDRLQIAFVYRGFGVRAMSGIDHVICRRNADGIATHFTFPPAIEQKIRAAIERTGKAEDIRDAQNAINAAWAAGEAQREAAAAAKSAARAAELDVLVAANPVNITFGYLSRYANRYSDNDTLTMPYAAGAPSKIKACGGKWNENAKVWVFAEHRMPQMVDLVPELSRLVAAQRVKDAKSAGKPTSARKPKAMTREQEDWQLENDSDSGITSRLSQTADEVRRERARGGRS